MSEPLDFLTPGELRNLTGSRIHADQRDWLIARQWIFEPDKKGRPKVLRAYAVAKLGGAPQPKAHAWQPDFSDLAEAG